MTGSAEERPVGDAPQSVELLAPEVREGWPVSDASGGVDKCCAADASSRQTVWSPAQGAVVCIRCSRLSTRATHADNRRETETAAAPGSRLLGTLKEKFRQEKGKEVMTPAE